MLRLFSTLLMLLAFPSLSNAFCWGGCGEDHSELPIKTHAQQFVEDLSAPREQRVSAMMCLGFYGKEGVPILSRVLERESDNFDSIAYAVMALRRIQDRGVMEPMLQILGYDSKGSEQSKADWNFTFSRKITRRYGESAVEILAELAFTSLEEPNPYRPAKVKRAGDRWIISSNYVHEPITIRVCGGYYSKGELLRKDEINTITDVLRKIVLSETEDTTERAKRVIRAAYKGLDRVERRMALLKKYGPKPEKASKSESK